MASSRKVFDRVVTKEDSPRVPQPLCTMGRVLQDDSGGSIDSPRASAYRSDIQRTSTHWTGSHGQCFVPTGGEWEHSILRSDRSLVSGQQLQLGTPTRRFWTTTSGEILQRPKEITNASTVLRIAKTLLNEIDADDNVPFYNEFVKDIEELEKANGVLTYQDELRNRLVTFIAENYVPRETGRTICPACLTETPNNLSICIRCHGSLSWGEKSATQDESTAPGMPERERRQSNDGTEGDDGDVEMDKDEIDRLVKESKKKAEERTDMNRR